MCAFHLRNREANRPLRVTSSGTSLEYYPNPLYLGDKLDRTLSYRSHILSTKVKVNTRNNILRKLTNSKWGCTPHTLRTSTLALCYTAVEYACPVWSRSVHASKLDPALNNACRTITGCLKRTNISNLHLLAGIAPPEIRGETASRAERLRQSTDPRHTLFRSEPAPTRLKSRRFFLSHVQPSPVALQLRAPPKVSARAPAHRSYHFRGVKLKSCIKKIHHNLYISKQANVRIKHADTEVASHKKFGTDARVQ